MNKSNFKHETTTKNPPLSPTPPTPPTPQGAECPDFLPKKFWNQERGEVRLESLVKSYVEMEKKFSSAAYSSALEESDAQRAGPFHSIGVPKSADDYEIEIAADFLQNDRHINGLLHKANFTQDQAQLVYDLASIELMPLIQQVSDHFEAETENARLENHFGGREKWREISRQIKTWGQSHLPADAYDALAGSLDGIKAMHKMMGQGEEPSMLKGGMAPDGLGEEGLRKLMQDPRYWRDKDPLVVAKVTEGFKRLYPS